MILDFGRVTAETKQTDLFQVEPDSAFDPGYNP